MSNIAHTSQPPVGLTMPLGEVDADGEWGGHGGSVTSRPPALLARRRASAHLIGTEEIVAELPSAEEIKGLVSLLAPGLIIQALATRVRSGSVPELKDRLITYGVVSAAYYAVATPLFTWRNGVILDPWLLSLLEYAIAPAAVAIAYAYVVQYELDYKAAEKIGLHLAHHIPAAWDYTFEGIRRAVFLLVTLNDGTEVAGLYAGASFASSNKDERDLLLQELWDVEEGGGWKRSEPVRSVLLSGKDIRYIEIYGAENDQEDADQ